MEGELQKGDVVAGKLAVIRKLGGGGMGAVYEVEHQLTKHRRALKVLHKSQALNRRYVERLLREASVAGRLNTPYVVETLDAGMLEDGAPYLLMELIDGVALLDVIEGDAPLEAARTVHLVLQVCEGMAIAHDAGIVHRDLKPENILVLPGSAEDGGEEQVKIIDFGISRFSDSPDGGPVSRLTTEGTIIGTPYYMSPEQASGRDVDARTDVYAMGVILYEALTGRLPFIAETTGALFIKIGTGEHLPLKHRRRDIDPGLADVVERAFLRRPEERYADARALGAALAPFATRRGSSERVRRATADYESDPPRPQTSPGVAPMAPAFAETLEVDGTEKADLGAPARVPVQKSFAARGGVPAPVVVDSAAFLRPNSRELPTEELEAAVLPIPAAPAVPKELSIDGAPSAGPSEAGRHSTDGESLRSSEDDDLGHGLAEEVVPSSQSSRAPRTLPPWVGTTGLAALIAALVAAAILVIGDGEGPEPEAPVEPGPVSEEQGPTPIRAPEGRGAVVADHGEVDGSLADLVGAEVGGTPNETPETEPETDAETDASEVPRPRMIRATMTPSSMMSRTMMSPSMQSAAEEAGLLPDPYAP